MALQSTVPTSLMLIDFETTFGTVPTSNKKGRHIYYNPPFDWGRNQDQSPSDAVTGTRYPTKPWRGNINIGADLTLPMDSIGIGYFLYLATGAGNYAAEEYSYPGNVMVGTPTLTIATGVGTFSSGQTGAALNDMVIYENSSTGERFTAFIADDAGGDNTTWTLAFDLAGTSLAADITTATVIAIVTNLLTDDDTTITLSSGTGTLSQAEANSTTVGNMLVYDTTGGAGGAITKVFLRSTTSTTVGVYEQANRSLAADVSARPVLGIFARPYVSHLFKPLSSGVLPSAVLETRASMDTTRYHLARGVSVNTVSLMAGGDGEQVMTFGLLGVDEDRNETSTYDSSALAPFIFSRFEKPDFNTVQMGATYAGRATLDDVESIELTMSNSLDDANRAAGTSGLRRGFPAGFVQVSGTMVRHYQLSSGVGGATTVDDMDARTERLLTYSITSGSNQLRVMIPELIFKPEAVGVPTGVGRRVTAPFNAFYEDGTFTALRAGVAETITGAPVVFELINLQQSYV